MRGNRLPISFMLVLMLTHTRTGLRRNIIIITVNFIKNQYYGAMGKHTDAPSPPGNVLRCRSHRFNYPPFVNPSDSFPYMPLPTGKKEHTLHFLTMLLHPFLYFLLAGIHIQSSWCNSVHIIINVLNLFWVSYDFKVITVFLKLFSVSYDFKVITIILKLFWGSYNLCL